MVLMMMQLLGNVGIIAAGGAWLFPQVRDRSKCMGRTDSANRRARLAAKLGIGATNIKELRHLQASDMPPRNPDEARDFARRRGSEPEAAAQYGAGVVNAESL